MKKDKMQENRESRKEETVKKEVSVCINKWIGRSCDGKMEKKNVDEPMRQEA